jgi:uncharacterized membrane protein
VPPALDLLSLAGPLLEWAGLLVRWFHLIAGIGWIGSSFYFMWLDASLEPPAPPRSGVEGSLWMVHSGGFYQVEKRLIGPGSMPPTLHWFKFEALLTWISGIALLGIVYYASGGAYLIDKSKADLTLGVAVAISLGTIAVSWLVYDTLWASALADKKPRAATALSFLLLFVVVFGLCKVFGGRAAFVHVGAVLGTMMVANVWRRILPAQQKMIDATRAGATPDYSHGLRAKRRSVHNSYVTLPVIFMMFSNHYPALYAHGLNWVVLILMILLGALVRHVMILETKRQSGKAWLVPAVLTLGVVVAMTLAPHVPAARPTGIAGDPAFANDVRRIVTARCVACHSEHPTDDVFTTAPNGVAFDTLDQVRAMKSQVLERAVVTKTMPLANKTNMTDAERETLGAWLSQE